MALIMKMMKTRTIQQGNSGRRKMNDSSASHRSRSQSRSRSYYYSPRLKLKSHGFQFMESFGFYYFSRSVFVVVIQTILIYSLLGLIEVTGQDDSTAAAAVVVVRHRHHPLQSEPFFDDVAMMAQDPIKILERVETYLLNPRLDTDAAADDEDDDGDGDQEGEEEENGGGGVIKIVRDINSNFSNNRPSSMSTSTTSTAAAVHQNQSNNVRNVTGGSGSGRINHDTNYSNNTTIIVPKSFLNNSTPAIIKSDANSSAADADVAASKDNENSKAATAAADEQNRELISLNNNTAKAATPSTITTTEIAIAAAPTPRTPQEIASLGLVTSKTTNEILETISEPSNTSLSSRTKYTNESTLSSSLNNVDDDDSESDNHNSGSSKLPDEEIRLMKSVPISASFASSIAAITKSKRPKRSVVHLYDMVVCSTGCNPLAYKGYGCYCGFLGSGLIVDGIDKCCAKHDWCYHHAKCPPLLTYFVPYYWTCNDGRPKCVNDYRGWKGICGAHLCECDRQFAECLRKYPCPRGRAVCLSSPFRTPANNYHFNNYNYIEDPDIQYYYP